MARRGSWVRRAGIVLAALVCVVAGTAADRAWSGSAPTIAVYEFDPAYGHAGTKVEVAGQNLRSATKVSIGGTRVTSWTYDGTDLVFKVPENAFSGRITIGNSGNSAGSTDSFALEPTITSYAPHSGTIHTSITLKGSGFGRFGDLQSATVGGDNTSMVWVSQNEVKIAPGPAGGAIEFKIAGMTASGPDFTLLPGFTDPYFTPRSARRGDTIQIDGGGFLGTPQVSFGNVVVPGGDVTVGSFGLTLNVKVPSTALTSTVKVSTANGSATTPLPFKVLATVDEPDSGWHGVTGTVLDLTGNAFTGTTKVTVGGVAAVFTKHSDTALSLTIPKGAVTGPIAVTNAGGASSTEAAVVVDPTVTSFAPTSARAAQVVTLNGTGFGAKGETRAVSVGGVAASSVTWKSPTELQFAVPVGARTNDVSVTVGSAAPATSAKQLTVLPTLLGYDQPTYKVGDPLVIEGNALEGTTSVSFGGILAGGFTVAGDGNSISTTVPDGAATGPVTVKGAATLVGPTLHIAPTVSSLSVSDAGAGDKVTVSGDTFVGVTKVTVGGVSGAFTVLNPHTLKVAIPKTAITGPVVVTTKGGVTASDGQLAIDPHISSFSPTSAGAGVSVTLTGWGFGSSVETRTVLVGDVAADTVTWKSPTQLTFAVPPGAHSGAIEVEVGALPLTAETGTELKVPASIAGYDRATYGAGAPVTIQGSSLDGATAVRFGNVAAPDFTVVDDGNSISTTVPHDAVTAKVTVVTPGGSVVGPVLHVTPTITDFSPSSAPAGAVISITGNTFTGTTAVKFGTASASFKIVDAGHITATVPAGAPSGPFTVTNAGGTTASGEAFAPVPRLSTASPTAVGVSDTVTLKGSGLDAVDDVEFAGAVGSAQIVSATPTALGVVVPDGAISGDVVVSSSAGTASIPVTVNFTVTGISYTAAPVDAIVEITGVGFTGASHVILGSTQMSIPSNASILDDSHIVFHVPHVVGNNLRVVVAKGSRSAGAADTLSVLNVSSYAPTYPAEGGTLHFTGSGFAGTQDVEFIDELGRNWLPASSFEVNDDGTELSVDMPDGYLGGSIKVVLDNGLVFQDNDVDTAYIHSVSPASGAAGDSITISGANFYDVSAVEFNGTPAASYTVDSSTAIHAVVPAGATAGPITVSVPGGTMSSPGDFTVTG